MVCDKNKFDTPDLHNLIWPDQGALKQLTPKVISVHDSTGQVLLEILSFQEDHFFFFKVLVGGRWYVQPRAEG